MIKNLTYQLLTFLYFHAGFAQNIPLQTIGQLDNAIHECSGIELLPSGHIAMINDSGNHPDVFFTTRDGQIVHKTCLMKTTNKDWEEIAYANGNLYIGDFGNNDNDRRDLKIYIYGVEGEDSVFYRGQISFQYADQKNFPPPYSGRNYDMEAMVVMNDSLFLFSKNRTRPFTGYTYQYGMPAQPGNYTLSRIDSFKTGVGKEEFFWIAGADYNPPTNTLALLGYDKVWLFSHFSGSHFFKGEHQTFGFESLTQKESICFLDNETLIITDEKNFFGGGNIYLAKIPRIATSDSSMQVEVPQQEFADSIEVLFAKTPKDKILWEIFSSSGKRVLAGNADHVSPQDPLIISTEGIPAGGYVLNVIVDGKPHAFKIKKLYRSKTNK